jgi:hypothetical protein
MQEMCSACKTRPATRRFVAPVREDGPIAEASVCQGCYEDLISAAMRAALPDPARSRAAPRRVALPPARRRLK